MGRADRIAIFPCCPTACLARLSVRPQQQQRHLPGPSDPPAALERDSPSEHARALPAPDRHPPSPPPPPTPAPTRPLVAAMASAALRQRVARPSYLNKVVPCASELVPLFKDGGRSGLPLTAPRAGAPQRTSERRAGTAASARQHACAGTEYNLLPLIFVLADYIGWSGFTGPWLDTRRVLPSADVVLCTLQASATRRRRPWRSYVRRVMLDSVCLAANFLPSSRARPTTSRRMACKAR